MELASDAATPTKNFLSISFPLRGGGLGGGAAEKMEGNVLSLPARVRVRGRGACQRDRGGRFGLQATTHAAREYKKADWEATA
jgi:hypothetical protein